MAKVFPFEIHTPYRLFYSGSVEAVVITLTDGEIGVYAGHSFFTAPAVTGVLKIREKGGLWRSAFTTEGILEVTSHRTVLMADAAEWPQEIDYERALAAKQKAEEILRTAMFKFETENAKATLKRAECRMKVYGLK
ncbi:MAG: ATP synthase F1 subunit epsilon [Treponema sp.]|jgi:F-type H+-transporting ATPase subunit epsilon|nr:ATP synthase F1 subunit epsilon [Treponema sp.]